MKEALNQRGKLLHNKVAYNVCIHTFGGVGGCDSIAERNVSVGDSVITMSLTVY